MIVTLGLLAYAILALLCAVIIRIKMRLEKMVNKRITYELLISPDELIELLKRDPVEKYFSPHKRAS